MKKVIYQVDSFTDRPFTGNPAGVCILEQAVDENWMKAVAAEMNISETAFLYPENNGYNLRWFTPTIEVELCGHATLAAAHILYSTGRFPLDEEIIFHTKSGRLTASKNGNHIELNFPATPPDECSLPVGLLGALGCDGVYVGRNKFDYLVEVNSETVVRNLSPNFDQLSHLGVRGVIVTAQSETKPYDIISRFFAPRAGINEDPVTGSAHCTLSPYWTDKLNKNPLIAYQASKRGGELKLTLENDRVILSGQAVTVMKIGIMFDSL